MVVLLSVCLFVFLLMMLVECIATGPYCNCCCNLLFYLVLVGVLWVFLCLMLLMLIDRTYV